MFNLYVYHTHEKKSEKADYTHEELLFIYERIHSYIMQNDVLILQILGFTLTLVTAAIAFSFQVSTSYIYKVETLTGLTGIVAISATQTFRRVSRTFMMSVYLRVVIEPKLANIRWETHLDSYRSKHKKRKDKKQSLKDFQQAAVLLTYQYVLLGTVVVAIFYIYRLYAEIGKYYVMSWQSNITLHNNANLKLNIAAFSLLLSIGLGIYIFYETNKLRSQANSGIKEIWDKVLNEKNL